MPRVIGIHFPSLSMIKTRILDWQNLQHTLADSICWSPSPGYRSTPHGQRPLHLKWIKTVKNTFGFSKFAWDWELSIVSSSCWYHVSWKGKDQNLILLSLLEFWSIIIHSREKIEYIQIRYLRSWESCVSSLVICLDSDNQSPVKWVQGLNLAWCKKNTRFFWEFESFQL